ncbi:PREDICTED: myotubularin-related protein 6-like [Priapulus caudatus]|uniref:phosphatidylinositol-3,5-bisphosphate 3-phosphatase n=1 Tax=Priapulus caudatus TaxID=37621 RepID=A0ABM1EF98_PRICU|nr:PREDICTED: myotubularin-related protein 6-like [Priapulus caudatus]
MEHIKTAKVENVRLLDRYQARRPSIGTLYITTTHLIFVDTDRKRETWVLLMHIGSVDRLSLTTVGSPLQIRCKTFHCVTFVIPRERDCQDVYTALLRLSRPLNIEELYAFHYRPSTDDLYKSAGWAIYDMQAEYSRMGVPNDNWCLSGINKEYEATITRCSQPLSGFSARCVEDELMLHCILKANPSSRFMYVVDTRPKINAMANKATGKGYENESFYSDIKFMFLGIENIHVMRNSLQKLIDVCELKDPGMSDCLEGLQSSGWLKHIKSVMDTSLFIASAVGEEGISVMVHCSDGWDRTAQTCSLASILLDPFYRTLQGFMVMQQFPGAFQFNERFLLTIHDHVYSCQYGTFLGNCEKDRIDLRLPERTYSLWGYMLHNMSDYINPLYRRDNKYNKILKPNTGAQNVRLWRGMYNRFESGVHPRESVMDVLCLAKDQSSSLEDHIQLLGKRISTLKTLLGRSDGGGSVKDRGSDRDSLTDSAISSDAEADARAAAAAADTITTPTCGVRPLAPPGGGKLSGSMTSELRSECGESGVATSTMTSSSRSAIEENGGGVTAARLAAEVASVAVDWKSLRNVHGCACLTQFEHFTRKYHCWRCGEVFCTRCIGKHTPLPGHYSQRPVPVCRSCYKHIKSVASS